MSNQVFYMNDLYDTNILSTLTPAAGLVYGAYMRYSNGGRDNAYPSQAGLAERLGVNERTVRRAVKELVGKGYIQQVSSGKGSSSKHASVYTVKTPSQLGFTSPQPCSSAAPQSATPTTPLPLVIQRPTASPEVVAESLLSNEQQARAAEICRDGNRRGNKFFLQFKTTGDFLKYFEKVIHRHGGDIEESLDAYQLQAEDTHPDWKKIQGRELA